MAETATRSATTTSLYTYVIKVNQDKHKLFLLGEEMLLPRLFIISKHLSGGLLFKKLKYFKIMLDIFEFSHVWENVEFCLVSENKLSSIAHPHFSTNIIQQS